MQFVRTFKVQSVGLSSCNKIAYNRHIVIIDVGDTMKVLYDTILKAKYTGRPNRFVVTLDLNGESVLAHLPNPGRMWELLFGCNDVHCASR